MVVLIIVAGLAVDVSRKFALEQKCQDVADAAALAGANSAPNAVTAKQAAVAYIQQSGGLWYAPADTDIQIVVSANNKSCTVGAIVRGVWDPVIMPDWLVGGDQYSVARYAIAISQWETSSVRTSGAGILSNAPGGPYALFVGETNPVVTNTVTGNGIAIIGSAHFNSEVRTTGNPVQAPTISNGVFEAPDITGSIQGATEIPTDILDRPYIDVNSLVFDVLLDQTNSNQAAYYTAGDEVNMVRPGTDGLYGTADDIPILATDGTNVRVEYLGGNKWDVTTVSSGKTIDASNNFGIGAGVDVRVRGDLDLGQGAGMTWTGSLQAVRIDGTSNYGVVSLQSNSLEFRAVLPSAAVAGLDNPSLAIHAGQGSPEWDQLAFNNNGNMVRVYGVLYAQGTLAWTGNMANAPAAPGPAGSYSYIGSNPNSSFVKGSIIAGDLDSSGGGTGGISGNNVNIWYDGDLAGGLPITNAQTLSPEQYSTPTVWLHR
jgi:hypothetical protein